MVATSVDNPGDVVYPESDGAPMADNPTQGRAIRYLVHGFERLYHGRPDVFVGGDFFWYPVEGQPTIVQAPDVTVIAGLPGPIADRDMPSYRQWVYGGHVLLAVEVLSPSNTWRDMARRLAFYDTACEYWVFDPYEGVPGVRPQGRRWSAGRSRSSARSQGYRPVVDGDPCPDTAGCG
ncbi:MAG: Uma2 family endonuclease [Ilumatobacteraceae bacterium]